MLSAMYPIRQINLTIRKKFTQEKENLQIRKKKNGEEADA